VDQENLGAQENLTSSGDGLFQDANSSFSDSAPSSGSMEPLQDAAADVEIGNIKFQELI